MGKSTVWVVREALEGAFPDAVGRVGSRVLVPALCLMGYPSADPGHGVTAGLTAAGPEALEYKVHRSNSAKRKGKTDAATRPRLSALGVATLQGILEMPYRDGQAFADSLAAQSPQDLWTLAMDRGGCRCVEAFLRGGAGRKSKTKVLRTFTGKWYELARSSAAAARTVEVCFECGGPEDREVIGTELSARATSLGHLRWGAALLRTCDVAGLQRSKDAWATLVEKTKATLGAFKETFLLASGDRGGGEEE